MMRDAMGVPPGGSGKERGGIITGECKYDKNVDRVTKVLTESTRK